MKICYLFTSFPLLSERFLLREVETVTDLGADITIVSMHRGETVFRESAILRMRWYHWLLLPLHLLREIVMHPRAILRTLAELFRHKPAEPINIAENLLGMAFAITHAPYFRRQQFPQMHAVWATAPAAAALLLKRLTGTPYSMGAHAYDVFRHGGDWILEIKLRHATLIHTSTEATATALRQRGAPTDNIVMIRRGLTHFPTLNTLRHLSPAEPIRLLAVGRLIEKKGYDSLLQICQALKQNNIAFHCRIVGEGPLLKHLQELQATLHLENDVSFTGKQSHQQVDQHYRWADIYCFTGRIAASNDRDGLPNVIGEAMAYGVPVLTSDVSGTTEAIHDGVTGRVLDPRQPDQWVQAVQYWRDDFADRQRIQQNARKWVEENFNAAHNTVRLAEKFRQSFRHPH